jgi:5-methylcytosine-specific restriction endonuclease McrA
MLLTNTNVLVLNQDYQPLSICSVQRSLVLLFLDKAELLHDVPEKVVKSVSARFEYPSVIRLKRYIRLPYKEVTPTRKNILKRDRMKCQYCGTSSELTIDHVLPRSRGGQDVWTNLVTACTKCNQKKGNRTPEEAQMPLKKKPYKPHHISFLRDGLGTVQHEWKPYLYML